MLSRLQLAAAGHLTLADASGVLLLHLAQSIALGSPARSPVAYGPIIRDTSLSDVVLRLYRPPDLVNAVAVLDGARDISWRDVINDAGAGSLTLQNDDTDLALVDIDDVIRLEVYGYAAFAWIVRQHERVTLAEHEEVDQATKLDGPGIIAVLDGALVYPARGVGSLPIEEDRSFNWSSVDYDDTAWVPATIMALQGATTTPLGDSVMEVYVFVAGGGTLNADFSFVGMSAAYQLNRATLAYWFNVHHPGYVWSWPGSATDVTDWLSDFVAFGSTAAGWEGHPKDWPDPGAAWIWAHTETYTNSQPGFCYARGVVSIATAGRVKVFATGDNGGDLYFDGIPVITRMNNLTQIFEAELDVTVGDHTIAMAVGNTPDPLNPLNPGGMLATVMELHTDQSLGAVLAHTDASWKIIEFPGYAPGMTPGEVIRHVVEEAQARGCILDVTLMFTDEVDSDGAPWTETPDIATKVGTDVMTFIGELTTYIDVWMAPTNLELYAWVKGTRGTTRAVSFHAPTSSTDPTTGNLRSLTHKTAS